MKGSIHDSILESMGKLELPKADKKVRKLIVKSAKRIAEAYVSLLKRENKKRKKVEKSLTDIENILKGKKRKRHGDKTIKKPKTRDAVHSKTGPADAGA